MYVIYKYKGILFLRSCLTKQLIAHASFQNGRYFNGKNPEDTLCSEFNYNIPRYIVADCSIVTS